MIISILFFIAAAFVMTGLFSGSEMAYLSCNKLKLRHLADQGNRRAQEVMGFHRKPKLFLTTVLIGNNLMHVTIVGLATYLFKTYLNISEEWVITAILALPLVIFTETIPKDWFRHKADDFIYVFAPLLAFLNRCLSGVSHALVAMTDFMIKTTTGDLKRNPLITREEFRYVIEESTKGGVLLDHEKQLINTILNLGSVQVSEVMIPLSRFPKVSLTSHIKDVKQLAREIDTDVVLVYEEIPTLVVGLVYVFDVLFEDREDQVLSHFLKPPLFIPEETSSEKTIFLLQSKRASSAVVINAKREVIGVVRLENLIRT